MKRERQVYLDYLRVIATIFVIGVHTVSLGASLVQERSVEWYGFEVADYLFLCCNLLFVMISGALLLPVEGERAGTFYKKRFTKVLVPMVLYYILYVCAKEGIEWIFPDHWLKLLRRILTGAPEEAPHFWLIYVILWLYVLTPVIRCLLQHIPEGVLDVLVIVIVVVHTLYTYVEPLYGSRILGGIVDSFVGVFIIGYFLTKEHGKGVRYGIYALGVVSVVAAVRHIFSGAAYERYIFNNAPLMVWYAMAVFLLVKEVLKKKTDEPVFVKVISRYSFGILLIHWGVLHYVVKQLLHVNVTVGYGIVGSICMIVLTMAISLAGAALLDHVLIAPVLKLLNRF